MDDNRKRDLEPHPDDWRDLEKRADTERRRFFGRQPRSAADVMAEVMQRRGYATIRATRDYSEAWTAAAGEQFAGVTEVGALKRGVLEITAANSLVMQELTFEKERLLAAMKQSLPEAGVKQLRFRVGKIG